MNTLQAIKRALRLIRALEPGSDLTAEEATDALAVLQSLVLALPGASWWRDVEIAANYTASENERLRYPGAGTVIVTLPTTVTQSRQVLYSCDRFEVVTGGCECAARAPADGARIMIVGAPPVAYHYRGDTGTWTLMTGLTRTSELPLNADLQDGFCAMLAVALVDEFGGEIREATAKMSDETEGRMRARYRVRAAAALDRSLSAFPSSYERYRV